MQGFNMGRYHPPPETSRPPKRKMISSTPHQQIVRFESPFAIWCTTCRPEQIIGQGVRFNAQKRKVGSYYTTAIWEFRIKHTVCGGEVVVRTDPQRGEYVVVSGGRRRAEAVPDEDEIGVTVLGKAGEEAKERLETDGGGFGLLEKKVVDKNRLISEKDRLEELHAKSSRDWADPYAVNQRVRREFRVGRKIRKENVVRSEMLREKLSLSIKLLDEKDEDGQKARLVDFAHEKGDRRPMFTQNPERRTKKERLKSRVVENTKATLDPFLQDDADGGMWQKRLRRKETVSKENEDASLQVRENGKALVGYNSDSELDSGTGLG